MYDDDEYSVDDAMDVVTGVRNALLCGVAFWAVVGFVIWALV